MPESHFIDLVAMLSTPVTGALIVAAAGLILGSAAWPMKLIRRQQFEHWWLVAMAVGLVVIPWSVTLALCPHPFKALAAIPARSLITANLWSTAWGVANILGGICFVRIGVSLTTAILTGLGAAIGVILPMLVKGSGTFQHAPDLNSHSGKMAIVAVVILLAAVVVAAIAGMGREKAQAPATPIFRRGLSLAIIAGILSSGMGLSFVYGQDAIVQAMKAEGAGDIPATFATWAFALAGGALVNLIYPVVRITSQRSWTVLIANPKECWLAAIIGLNLSIGLAIMAQGMLTLGAFGGSTGLGIQQATWMLGGQALGTAAGEWRGARSRVRAQMALCAGLLLVAVMLLTAANES